MNAPRAPAHLLPAVHFALSHNAIGGRAIFRVLRVMGLCTFLVDCAPALPLLAGGSTVPPHRGMLGAGVAANVPLGRASDGTAIARSVRLGGVTPLGFARIGVRRRLDLGLLVSGTALRAEVRGRWQLNRPDAMTRLSIVAGISPYGGWIDPERDGRLARLGAEVPVLFAVDASSIVELWTGARMGLEHAWGDLSFENATGFRAGPVVGFGLGFRHFAALAEITVFVEHWNGSSPGTAVTLVPASALRVQF